MYAQKRRETDVSISTLLFWLESFEQQAAGMVKLGDKDDEHLLGSIWWPNVLYKQPEKVLLLVLGFYPFEKLRN